MFAKSPKMDRVSCLSHLGSFLGYFDSQALRLVCKSTLHVPISDFTSQELYRDFLKLLYPKAYLSPFCLDEPCFVYVGLYRVHLDAFNCRFQIAKNKIIIHASGWRVADNMHTLSSRRCLLTWIEHATSKWFISNDTLYLGFWIAH